jgi:hypothetical protein
VSGTRGAWEDRSQAAANDISHHEEEELDLSEDRPGNSRVDNTASCFAAFCVLQCYFKISRLPT